MFLIFPHQLFYNNKYLLKDETILLIEEPRFFTDFNFHKLKLAFHRASMKAYYDFLITNNYDVRYITFEQITNDYYKKLKNIRCVEVNDHKLANRLKNATFLPNINFLVDTVELSNIKKLIYNNNKYLHDRFYKYQRIKLNILVDSNNKPIGNKWSFDKMNRIPLPKDHTIKPIPKNPTNKYVKEAIKYVYKHFSTNYGDLSEDNFIFPIDNKSSLKWLKIFLKYRLTKFGKYEDAVHSNDDFIYHSVLSPMMNIGIITDKEVVNISYKYYLKHQDDIPLESIEAFLRQIIGWRNYVYVLYILEGKNMFESNQLEHTNELPYDRLWNGTTGILPIDNIINKIIKYSYAHHIERLMFLGSYLLLLGIDPKQVYNIFMEWTIDAYDWVMVPNIFGMSQYSSPIMMTRPYFSSYNYLLKMSNYKKDEWCVIWGALYYTFLNRHRKLLIKNYAFASQIKNLDNKSLNEKKKLFAIAKDYQDRL